MAELGAPVRCVALIGGGVIGGGWAGRLVEHGIDVVVHDPHPDAARRVEELAANAARVWARLTPAPRRRGTLSFAPTLAEAVGAADLVQESAPEVEELKRRILEEIDAHAADDVIVCSSTSGLLPTRLQSGMSRPERFLVGHPFNPVYLLPLVEVCGGEQTSEVALARASAFYTSVGMRPLRLRREIDGFVADRLLEALWREALWLVHDDVATTEEVDDAIRYGAGLRWAHMGTFLTYRIAGGEQGMRHFMAQFGPALQWPWTKLTEVPELSDAFLDKLEAQSDAQARGRSVGELERVRDDALVAILQALRAEDVAAGRLLNQHEARLHEMGAVTPADLDQRQPLPLVEVIVDPAWVDYNGHMTESRYLEVFANATDALLRFVGMDGTYLEGGHSVYTVETHIRHLADARGGEPLSVDTQVLGADAKRIHLFHSLTRAGGALLATGEHMLLHVDTGAGRVCPMLEPLARRVAMLAESQSTLPPPDGAGRAVTMRG